MNIFKFRNFPNVKKMQSKKEIISGILSTISLRCVKCSEYASLTEKIFLHWRGPPPPPPPK